MLRPPTIIFRSLHVLWQSLNVFVTLFQAIQKVELMASIRTNLGHIEYMISPLKVLPVSVQIVWLLMIQGTTQPDDFSMWFSRA